MLEFIVGVIWGILAVFTFFYGTLLGLARYIDIGGDLPVDVGDVIDSVLWFLGLIGFVRIVLYVSIALLWPIPVVALVVLFLRHKECQSSDDLPKKTLQRFDWLVLGFGKLIK